MASTVCSKKANKTILQELISCHFKNIQSACGTPFGFIFYLSLLRRHGYLLRVLPSECWELETLSPCSMQRSQRMSHIITFFHWQGLGRSSVVGSSVKVNSVAVIRPVARSGAEAGQEMVPIPCVPSSAICHWAGAERSGGRSPSHPCCCHRRGALETRKALRSFSRSAVAVLAFFFFKAHLLYRCSNLVINTVTQEKSM